MNWKDTIRPVETEVSTENVGKMKELYPDSFANPDAFSVSNDDGEANAPTDISEEEQRNMFHYFGQVPVGAVERGFSYFNPVARGANRVSTGMLDMGVNPMAAFVEGAPIFEKNSGAAESLRRQRGGDTQDIWGENPVYDTIVGRRTDDAGEDIARAGGGVAMDSITTFGLAYPFLAARAAALAPVEKIPLGVKAKGLMEGVKSMPSKIAAAPAKMKELLASESSGGRIGEIGSKYLDDIARFVAEKPKTALWMDTMSGLGAGSAAEAARQAGAGPTGEFAAGLAGGLTGGLAATGGGIGMLTRGARDVKNYAKSDAYASREVDKALRRLNQSLTDPAEARIAEATAIKDKIPGFDFTLGEAAGDVSPSFVTDQITLQNQLSGSTLDKAVQAKSGAINAVRDFERSVVPENFGMDEVKLKAENLIRNAKSSRESALDTLSNQKTELAEKLPESNRFAIGERIRGAYDKLEDETSQLMGKQAEELGLNTKNITGYKSLKNRYEGILGETNAFVNDQSIPTYLKNTINKMEGLDKPFTFQDVKTIREESGRLMRKELNSAAPDTRKVSIYKKMRDATDEFLDQDLPKDMGDMGDKYSAWRKSYVDNYVKRFEQGGVHKVGEGISGDYVTENERIADIFFKKGDQSSAKQFKTTFGGDPAAQSAMRDAILDKARHAAIKDGEINPKAMSAWVKEHSSILDEFPDVKKELLDVNASASQLMNRGKRLAERAKEVDQSFVAKVVGSDDTGNVINQALRDHKKMREIRMAAKDNPDALRRAVWEKVVAAGGQGDIPSGALMKEYIDKHHKALGVVFEPKHLKDLEDVATAYEMLGRVPKPFGKSISNVDPVEQSTGSSAKSLMSSYRAIRHGRTSGPVEGTGIAGRFLYARGKNKANAALLEALYKPELVRDLKNTIKTEGRNRASYKRLNTWFLMNGIDSSQKDSVPQQEEEE